MHKLNNFIKLFKTTPYWEQMVATVEASCWHREANVSVHTEMCIAYYNEHFAPFRTGQQNILATLALLFHDVGKPAAEETLDKKDGSGQYRRYAGHEPISAVVFTECYMTMPALRELVSPREARAIRWCIEHHLPYGMTNKVKRQGLRDATSYAFSAVAMPDETYFDVLRSDCAGRISDDHATKLAAVETWISEFKSIGVTERKIDTRPIMFILIGASGSGKSTWIRKICETLKVPNITISHDEQKELFFSMAVPGATFATAAERYDAAWKYCTLEKESSVAYRAFFDTQVKQKMEQAKTTGAVVFIDIVNASKKKRQMWVDHAKRANMQVIAVEFWNAFDTLIARQTTRGDKRVPYSSVRQQVDATTCVWEGHEAGTVCMELGPTF